MAATGGGGVGSVLGEMIVKVGLDASGLEGGLGKAAEALAKFADGAPAALAPLAVGAAVAAAAVVGVGLASIKAAGDFQEGMTSLQTGAGELDKNMAMVGTGIKQISVDTGATTKDLVAGMYLIESAGYHGADGLKVLTTATQGAQVGNADLAKTAGTLTTIMHDYNVPVAQSVPVMNSMIATTKAGKMTMDDLNGALTNVLPVASKAGVSFTDVEGALATMSLAGDKGSSAGTHLAQMFKSLEVPTTAATKELKLVGLTTDQIAAEMKVSLPGTIQMITDAIGKKFPVGSAEYLNALSKIVGGSKQMQAALELSGTSMSDLVANTKAVSDAFKASGKDVTGYDKVQEDLNTQLKRVSAAINVLMINIGQMLLPVVTAITKAFANFVAGLAGMSTIANDASKSVKGLGDAAKPVVDVWGELGKVWNDVMAALKPLIDILKNEFAKSLKEIGDFTKQTLVPAWNDFAKSIGPALPALKLLGEIIGGAILVGLVLWVKLMEGVIIVIVLVIAGVVKLGQGLMILISWAVQAGKAIIAAFQAAPQFFSDLWKKIQDGAGTVWKWITDQAQGAWKAIVNAWGAAGQWFQDVGKAIQKGFADVWKWIQDQAKAAWKGVQDVWGAVGQWFQDRWKDISKAFQTGIKDVQKFLDNFKNGITNALKWLYDHNYYVKNAWDAITKFTTKFVADFKKTMDDWSKNIQKVFTDVSTNTQKTYTTGMTAINKFDDTTRKNMTQGWTTFSSWYNKTFGDMSTSTQKSWNEGMTGISKKSEDTTKTLQGHWGDFQTWYNKLFGDISTNVQKVWTEAMDFLSKKADDVLKVVEKFFSDWWDKISKSLGDALTGIKDFCTKALGALAQWGTDVAKMGEDAGKKFVDMLVSGIKAGVGAVADAAKALAASIWANLGFHSPTEEGPGKTADQWMPALVTLISEGLEQGVPKVGRSAQKVAAALGVIGSSSTSYPIAGRVSTNASLAGASAQMTQAGDGQQKIIIQLDTAVIAQAVSTKQMKVVRLRTGRKY